MANTWNNSYNSRYDINANTITQYTKFPLWNITTTILWICNNIINHIFDISRNNKKAIYKEKWRMAIKYFDFVLTMTLWYGKLKTSKEFIKKLIKRKR